MTTKLTPHFTLKEMTVTNTGMPNHIEERHYGNLKLTAFAMEHVRYILGDKPITITSAYRSPAVNKAVGGVSNSDHALAYACDFYRPGLSCPEACKILRDSFLRFDQLIWNVITRLFTFLLIHF